jgi:hypothetical protein
METRTVTDTRLNPMFRHEIGTVITILEVDGFLVEYSVDGKVFYTRITNLKNYSK